MKKFWKTTWQSLTMLHVHWRHDPDVLFLDVCHFSFQNENTCSHRDSNHPSFSYFIKDSQNKTRWCFGWKAFGCFWMKSFWMKSSYGLMDLVPWPPIGEEQNGMEPCWKKYKTQSGLWEFVVMPLFQSLSVSCVSLKHVISFLLGMLFLLLSMLPLKGT